MAIVVSHLAASFDALERQALRQAPLADLIELRLDRIGHPGEERLRDLVARAGKPVIVTVHGPENGGAYAGDLDERLELLHAAARAGASFVDVDWRLSLELGELEGKCHRIVSRHEAEGTPDDLMALEDEVREVLYEGDVIKLVTHARSAEDGLRMLRHLRATRGGLIAFCSGAAGRFTRVLCRLFGSAFTYAAPAAMPGEAAPEPTAPGQLRVNDLHGLLPPGGGGPHTAVFGVVGDRLGHSFSPHVHGMALKMARLDAVYLAFETADAARFFELADDDLFRGFSVTAPHKRAAHAATERRDEASRACGASNTLVRDPHGWRALNTDVAAVRETLERGFRFHLERSRRPAVVQGSPLASTHTLVLGAGGAARAVVHAVRSAGGRASVAARDAKRGSVVAREMGCDSIAWDAIPDTRHDILVNATPVGTADAGGGATASPVPTEWIWPGTLVLDAVYNPVKTPFLEAALERGCTPVPGAEWFVRQAAEQFRAFTRQEPDDKVLRAAFENALGAPA